MVCSKTKAAAGNQVLPSGASMWGTDHPLVINSCEQPQLVAPSSSAAELSSPVVIT